MGDLSRPELAHVQVEAAQEAKQPEFKEFVLRSQSAAKQYHVARFQGQKKPPDYSQFVQPVRMYREGMKDKMHQQKQPGRPSPSPPPPAAKQAPKGPVPGRLPFGRKPPGANIPDEPSGKAKDIRGRPWILEDDDAKNGYTGTLEGGQNSHYVLFVMQGNEFRIFGASDWYRFRPRPKKELRALTLEEAEEQIAKGNRKIAERVDRFLIKKPIEEKKPIMDDDDAGVKGESDDEREEQSDDDDDKRRVKKEARPRRRTGEDEEGGGEDAAHEDMDFEEIFDDDEIEIEVEAPGPDESPTREKEEESAAEESSSSEEEGEEGAELTKSGLEMKELLKRTTMGRLGNAPDQEVNDNDDDSDVDDDFNPEENFPTVLYPSTDGGAGIGLGAFSSSTSSPTETSSGSSPNGKARSTTPNVSAKSKGAAPGIVIRSEGDGGAGGAASASSDRRARTPEGGKGASSSGSKTAASSLGVGRPARTPSPAPTSSDSGKSAKSKRPHSESPSRATASPSGANNKKARTETPSASASAADTKSKAKGGGQVVKITEEEMRSVLLSRGRLKTKELIEIFKPAMAADKNQKTLFADIVKKIARVDTDGGDKYIILKDEFR